MSSAKKSDEAFANVGKTSGIVIWRIENLKLVKLRHEDQGSFYSGDCYILLHTKVVPNKAIEWNIHYWLGKDCSIDERTVAAYKSVELDDFLGGRPVQYREVQFHETSLFLSYFEQTGIRYLEGGFQSGLVSVKDLPVDKKLYMVKGKKDIRMVQVPLEISSLNKSDVFILDIGQKIFQWNPPGASHTERLKASVYSKRIRDNEHSGKVEIVVVESDWDSNAEFWSEFKGDASQVKQESDVKDDEFEKKFRSRENSLFKVCDFDTDDVSINLIATGSLKLSMLDSDDCFIVDCGSKGIFTWIGKKSTKKEKQACVIAAKKLIEQKNYPDYISLITVIDGGETTTFKALFQA